MKITIEAEAKEIADILSALKSQTFSKDIKLFPQKKSYMSGELRNLLDSSVRKAMKELNEQFKT
ncbi:MAG: hypothetical protein K2N27_09790 [Ruminococcus sp.]|nr:hypothetical protein [Ruminococcus sp.]MDE7365150.1 hypothetical protein [Ruminococcus sp.]